MDKIKLTKHLDYYAVHYGKLYGEVSPAEARIIQNAISIIKNVLAHTEDCITFRNLK